jgi:hypothetical protein
VEDCAGGVHRPRESTNWVFAQTMIVGKSEKVGTKKGRQDQGGEPAVQKSIKLT